MADALIDVICPACRRCVGSIMQDGTGPLFVQCPARRAKWPWTEAMEAWLAASSPKKLVALGLTPEVLERSRKVCPMYAKLRRYQPVCRPTSPGNSNDGYDADAGSYRTVALRALEDAETDRV